MKAALSQARRRWCEVRFLLAAYGHPGSLRVNVATYLDGRRAVHMAFLAGAASNGVLQHLPGTLAEIAASTGAVRVDRLAAWLRVGAELGELSCQRGRWRVTGRRTRRLAAGDELQAAFYRSVAAYYFGPHVELAELIGDHPGRDDLGRHAETIAAVSRVTEPVLAVAVTELVRTARPATWLEVGCGTGVHLLTALRAGPDLAAVAVDLDAAVVAAAQQRVAGSGFATRVSFRVGDALAVVGAAERFDVVTLLNNVYYFAEGERPALLAHLAELVRPGGYLLVATLCAGHSVAAAQLDLLLRVQREAAASLPDAAELERTIRTLPTVTNVDVRRPVPTEPYLVIRAQIR